MIKKLLSLLAFLLGVFALSSCEETLEEDPVVEVESVSMSQPTAEMLVGDTIHLIATVLPSNASDKSLIWSSSKLAVATVDADGNVKALSVGTTTISASAGGKTGSCTVTVSERIVPVTSIELDRTELTLEKGQRETLVATVLPENATNGTVSWSTSKDEVAAVDANGQIFALGAGSAVITATAGEKSASCIVFVVIPVESVTLDNLSLTLEEEQVAQLTATISPADATDQHINWTSSDPEVATVDANGKVKALKVGTSTVTAQAGEKEAACSVTVVKKVIPVTSITLNKTSLGLSRGQSETLVATVSPDNATDKTVTWSSSDTALATVNQQGTVTAINGGVVVITAKSGEISASCAVTITVPVENIALDKTNVTLEIGKSTTLTAIISPNDATDKSVSWSSSESTVASVDANGVVTAKAEGSAVITAKNGNKSASCSVTVLKEVVEVTSISLDETSLDMVKGESARLTASVQPEDATDKNVSWSSSDATIASVDNGGNVKALKGGRVTISAKAGEKSATCDVTVTVPLESITLDKEYLDLEEGMSETLVATIKPVDATDGTVTWTSTTPSVAIVENGLVTAKAEGETVVIASAGGLQARCTVKVVKKIIPVTGIKLNRGSVTLDIGKSETLVATVSPSDATNQHVTWTSADSSVATVDENGTVTGVSAGSTTIQAECGGFTASCLIMVVVPVDGVTLDQTTLELVEGGSATLTATISPSDATNTSISWTSSDTAVATVKYGTVKAVAEGTAVITATASGFTATCTVYVSKAYFEVSPTQVEIPVEGASFEITVSTNHGYHLDSKPDWVSEMAVQNMVHQFKADPNADDNERSGVIVFCDDSGTCLPVSVKQLGTGGLAVSTTELECGLAGGPLEFEILTGGSWIAESNQTWCRLSATSGSGKTAVTVTVDRYEVKGTRSATITVKAGSKTQTVSVYQEGLVDFAITPTSVEVESEGGTFEIKVSCSTSYHISGMASWIKEESQNGRVLVFRVEPNPSDKARSGVVTLCDDAGTCLACTVTQKPKPHDADGGNEDVTPGNPINW